MLFPGKVFFLCGFTLFVCINYFLQTKLSEKCDLEWCFNQCLSLFLRKMKGWYRMTSFFFVYWMLWVLNNARWFSCKVMTTYERISIALLIPANVLYSLALFSHSWFQLPDVSYGLWVAKYCDYLSCQIIPAFFTEEPGIKRYVMRID